MVPMEALQKAERRLQGLHRDRYSFWVHWRDLADFILPRRYIWLVTPNRAYRGSQINQNILDSTGTVAARTCASGMMAGLTSPTRPWFKLKIPGFSNSDTSHPVALWLAECESRLMRVFSVSNFYNSVAVVYLDLCVFGTAAALIYEDHEDVIRLYNPCLGEYFLENDARMQVGVFARKFVRTLEQVVEEFGEENLPDQTAALYRAGGENLSQEITLCHLIEPNRAGDAQVAKHFKYREIYWVDGQNEKALRIRGFFELPGCFPRWDIEANNAYGRSPGMDALGDIKQLQVEQKRKAQAIDKMVNPPLMADVQLKNQPATLLPGGLTYVAGTNNVGIKPIYTVMPPVQELMEDIKEVQGRINEIFFKDLFMMVSQLETVRTATEIDARKEEKLIQLGPVIERFENEFLNPAITRTFNIMQRGGLIPPPPSEIQGHPVEIEYSSMLAEAQRAVATGGIERVLSLAGDMAAVQPDVLDNVDFDAGIDEYATLLGTTPRLIRDPRDVAKIRAQKAQQLQQQQMLEHSADLAKGAQVLSQTPVGAGGQSALGAITGQGGSI